MTRRCPSAVGCGSSFFSAGSAARAMCSRLGWLVQACCCLNSPFSARRQGRLLLPAANVSELAYGKISSHAPELRCEGKSLSNRPRALPELRRRAEDHRGDPGAAGDREGPHVPGAAGACAATLSCPRSSAASGLTIPIHPCSGGPARRAAGVGCVRVLAGPMQAARRQGVSRRRHPGKRFSAGLSRPNGSPPASKDRFKRIGRRVLPCSGCHGDGKRAFESPVFCVGGVHARGQSLA